MKGLAAIGLGLLPAAALAASLVVVDGDTLVIDGRTVELYGIDAPEIGERCARAGVVSDCGVLARAALMDLTAGAAVTCTGVPEAPAKTLCRANGYDLSEGMVYTGWATALAGEGRDHRALEAEARAAGRGLWSGFDRLPAVD